MFFCFKFDGIPVGSLFNELGFCFGAMLTDAEANFKGTGAVFTVPVKRTISYIEFKYLLNSKFEFFFCRSCEMNSKL